MAKTASTASGDEKPAAGDEKRQAGSKGSDSDGGAPGPSAQEGHPGERPDQPASGKAGTAALTLGALGVVFGDIGTSPLYALEAVFSSGAVRPDQAGVYGVISLVFWAVTIIVSVKYVTFVMRADNDGEGGIMALIALLERSGLKRRVSQAALVGLGIFGAALFYGDGMITPAISVLSAVEGLEVAAPSLATFVIPITLVVLTVLFAVQRFGTGAVGRLFGPVMCLWFGALAIAGLAKLIEDPSIVAALSPTYFVSFFASNGVVAFLALGGVVLAVTGVEALYADMGHFGRSPIRRAWFFLVFPALTLNYMGQGTLILQSPQAVSDPFYLLVPGWAQIPMVLLATAATVIASQAVISGAFSVTRQALQLGFLPWLRIRHTSREEGQIYSPAVNGGLFVAVVGLVIGFGSSSALASAYGIAVTGTLAIDTILFFVVVRALWHRPVWMVVLGGLGFLVVDLAFLGANLPKVPSGGWFPLVVAVVVFTVLMTWRKGRRILTPRRHEKEGQLDDFVEEIRAMDPPIYRAPGTAIFLHGGKETTPLALRDNVDYNRVLHESAVIVSIDMASTPHVRRSERLSVDCLGYEDDGISHMTLRFGFREETDVPKALREFDGDRLETDLDLEHANYFVSKMTIVCTDAKGMSGWRKKLFAATSHAADSPSEFFHLPNDRIVTLGSHIEL